MDARDTTAANADLWASYLRDQWRAWLDPFGLTPASEDLVRVIADTVGASVATTVSVMMGAPIARMYAANAPGVTDAIAHAAIDVLPAMEDVVVPPEYTRRAPDASQWEAWRTAAARPARAAEVAASENVVLAY